MDAETTARLAARSNVGAWIGEERRYADEKYDPSTDYEIALQAEMREKGAGFGTTWDVDLMNRLSRYQQHDTVMTPLGRQDLGKLIVILLHTLEAGVAAHGPMPQPGVPSGTIEEWVR